jgi:hypothetical protein
VPWNMEPAAEIPLGTARKRPVRAPIIAKKRARTRQGKVRLLTIDSLDSRTAAYASAMDLIETLSRDLGEDLSEGQKQLVTRVALIGAIVSDFETRWISGEQIALPDYLQACRTQCRLLALLGLQRVPRDVSPTLAELLRMPADDPPGENGATHD